MGTFFILYASNLQTDKINGYLKKENKKMKKIILVLMSVVMIMGLVACSSSQVESKKIEGTLEEIMATTYENTELELPMVANTEITDENIEYYLGTSDIEYTKALASEAMISAIAHSVVLVEVAEDADVEAIKTKIKENVNGFKWICVGVEDENIIVDNVGNLIILSMDNENSQIIVDSFLALAK